MLNLDQASNPALLAEILLNLGVAYAKLGNLSKAKFSSMASLEIYKGKHEKRAIEALQSFVFIISALITVQRFAFYFHYIEMWMIIICLAMYEVHFPL